MLNRKCPNNTAKCGAGRIISQVIGLGLFRVDGSYCDKRGAFFCQLREFNGKKIARSRFDVHGFLPELKGGLVPWIPFRIDACAMHHSVEASHQFLGIANGLGRLVGCSQIRNNVVRSQTFQFFPFEWLTLFSCDYNAICSFDEKPLHNGTANSTRSTGHQDSFPNESHANKCFRDE